MKKLSMTSSTHTLSSYSRPRCSDMTYLQSNMRLTSVLPTSKDGRVSTRAKERPYLFSVDKYDSKPSIRPFRLSLLSA